MNRLAAVTVLAAVALTVASPALAKDKPHPDTTHREVCHPTGKGWVLINPAQASSHIDETTGQPKHEHDGRWDTYAVNGACPVVPSPTTTRSTPSTSTTTTATSTASTTSAPSTSPTSTTSRPTTTSVTSSHTSTSTATTSQTGPPSTTTAPQITSTRQPSSTRSVYTGTSSPRSPHSLPHSATPTPAEYSPPTPELAMTGVSLSVLFLGLGLVLAGGVAYNARRRGEH